MSESTDRPNPYQPSRLDGVSTGEVTEAMDTGSENRLSSARVSKWIAWAAVAVGLSFSGFVLWFPDAINTFVITVAAWVVAPYLLVALAASRMHHVVGQCAVTFLLVALAWFGFWAFGQIFQDAQGGLILIFAPLYQLAASVLIAPLILLVDRLLR